MVQARLFTLVGEPVGRLAAVDSVAPWAQAPREHISSLNELGAGHDAIVGTMLRFAARTPSAATIVFNTNADAGQSVFHIHPHVRGGSGLARPPG